ncbi:unnamed protein product, partial [Ectocarpus fasciculatus]
TTTTTSTSLTSLQSSAVPISWSKPTARTKTASKLCSTRPRARRASTRCGRNSGKRSKPW